MSALINWAEGSIAGWPLVDNCHVQQAVDWHIAPETGACNPLSESERVSPATCNHRLALTGMHCYAIGNSSIPTCGGMTGAGSCCLVMDSTRGTF